MKKLLLLTILFCSLKTFAQEKTVNINVSQLKTSLLNIKTESEIVGQDFATNSSLPIITLPLPDGTSKSFRIVESPVWQDAASMKKADIRTYSGTSIDNDGFTTRFSLTSLGLSAIIKTPLTYYIIEPVDATNNIYTVYPINAKGTGKCDVNDAHPLGAELLLNLPQNRINSSSPFPNGTQLRVYRLAAAATGEFTTSLGSQAAAITKITQLITMFNAIYESEAAIRFSLITESTDPTSSNTIIFTTGASDPFTVDPNFASAANAQAGFDLMASATGSFANRLPYNKYDVGHVFNMLSGGGISASGQAGPTPCVDTQKARGWTEMTTTAAASYLGLVTSVAVHEIAHQFGVSHSYNAVGGDPSWNATFCLSGWPSTGAVEPGGGSTLMGYNSNCVSPNYTLSGSYSDSYFHTKSLEQIYVGAGFNNANGTTCGSFISTTNSIPVSNAGSDYTIPKGTPFTLTGSATDGNGDVLTYQWDEFDVATGNDKGSFGNGINGSGGYAAVNSIYSAPLFRSKQQTTPVRTFPALSLILQDKSDPAVSPNPNDNDGEDLPQVARTMKFRLTVLDNKANGGGVDSDETILTVSNNGPFLITSQNSPKTWISGGTATVTWSVNNTNIAPINCTNVKILLSTDGGNTYPTVILASTANDGSELITVPNITTTTGRIKIEAVGNIFFDINNSNITISNSTCPPPSVAAANRCSAGTLLLSASDCAGTYNWYSTSTGGSSLGSSSTYTTPSISTTTNYYVACTNGGCTSVRTVATATVTTTPTAPTSTGKSLCGSGSTTLFASGCTGTYSWYAAATGGSPLATGGAFTTPTINATTNYYVDCTENTCSSSRTMVTVTLNVPAATACTPTAPNGLSTYFGIANFTFTGNTTINVSTGTSSADGTNYTDNSCTYRTTVNPSTSYAVSVTTATSNSHYIKVYIDYNNNGVFTDAGETVLSGQTTLLTGNITIPATAVQSVPLRMRVLADWVSSSNSCTINGYSGYGAGQIEDYAITILSPCPTTLALASTADDISSGNVTKQASATAAVTPPAANLTATNKITGAGTRATYQAKSILLNAGFKADNGTIFKAEIGGCN